VLCALLAGCGTSAAPQPRVADRTSRLTFGYEAALPLQYVNRGRINPSTEPIAVEDVSFRAGNQRVKSYLLVPPGRDRRPAVVFVHGSGGDRQDMLEEARRLASRNVVALTITEPSTPNPPARVPGDTAALLGRVQASQVLDVVAIRRAVDLLQSLHQVDKSRIGYLGWSAGARTGTFVAASEPRVKAFALLSAGAAPVSEYVANAPADLRRIVRQVVYSLDPIRYVALARPGSVLLEAGTKDEIVPHSALMNIVRAAPKGTTVRWYDTPHALDRAAYDDAFDWLARKLPIDGPRVPGAGKSP
jgi:dienelactone hydrolase